MSYILDALRKADAQRERDASRGIHAQAASIGSAAATGDTGVRGGCFATLAAGVAVAAALGWFLLRGESAKEAPQASMPPPAMPAAATSISPPPPAPVAPVTQAPPQPAPLQAREAAFTARGAAVQGGASPSNAGAPAEAPSAAIPGTTATGAPQATATAVSPPIAGGLPPDAPRIAISGGVYSPNPAQRMLIVNGQVFNEGSEVAPGVKVESIQARTAVLGFRGARYTVAY